VAGAQVKRRRPPPFSAPMTLPPPLLPC